MTGRQPARKLRESIAATVAQHARPPGLAIVHGKRDPSAAAYAKQVTRGARRVGVPVRDELVDNGVTTAAVVTIVEQLAGDERVQGIILPLPLPTSVDAARVVVALPPAKDVDRITRGALGEVLASTSERAPGVAMAVARLLDYYEIPLAGRRVAVVGRSISVGKPVALLMLARDATVTLCHSRTRDLAAVTSQADVLVTCAGRPGLISGEHVKPGAVVVDVGTTYTQDGVRGDVDADAVASIASAYSPVPGGVGPLTVYCLLANLLSLASEAEGE